MAEKRTTYKIQDLGGIGEVPTILSTFTVSLLAIQRICSYGSVGMVEDRNPDLVLTELSK